MAKIGSSTKSVAITMFILAVLILFFGAVSISGSDYSMLSFFRALGVQYGFIFICILAYATTILGGYLLGFGDNKTFHIVSGLVIGAIYIIVASIIPGFSIAYPQIPAQIGATLQKTIVVGVAPIVETVFFLGVVLALLLQLGLGKHLAIWIQGVIFSLFHLGAYIIDLYSYSLGEGFLGFTMNISVFLSALIFGVLSGYIVTHYRWRGLLVAMVIHAMINLFAIIQLTIMFA